MAKNAVPNLCLAWLGNFEKLKKLLNAPLEDDLPCFRVTFYMRSNRKTKNCTHQGTSSYQKLDVNFTAKQAVHVLHVESVVSTFFVLDYVYWK